MNKEQIIKIFINELGEPNSLENLNEYLDFLLNYSYEYNKRCQINKNNWTEERKQIKSKQMKDYFKNNPDEMTERSKKMWSSMSSEKRKEFKDKMNIVNNDLNKRNKASKSIKEKWKDPSFKNKMKNRKTSSREVIAISPFGEIIKRDGIIEILEEFDFNIRLMHQFRNTNKPVESKNVKNKKNISNTIGWKFYYKRYGKTNIS